MANLNLNDVSLCGRITHDLEMKVTPQGVSVLAFSIAVQRRYDKTKTDFINCKAFKTTAENITKYFRKGSSIFVKGSIQTNNWQDQQGNKRYSTDIMVNDYFFVDSKNEVSNSDFAPPVTPKFEEIATDDILPF